MRMMEVLFMLKIENVSKIYKGGKKAVKNISLDIKKGSSFASLVRVDVERQRQ